MRPIHRCLLYGFVDTAYLRGRAPELIARQLCDGGADLIQLRAKDRPLEEVRHLAASLRPITEQAGVGLVINDYPEVAREVGAPLCHLGQEDFFDRGYAHASQVCAGRSPLQLGLSTHAPAQAQRALAAAPAYLAIGPVFATGTKPTATPVTLAYVRWASAQVTIPWFAIGGITLGNLDAVLEAGARRVCVVSAILGADDLVRTCQVFKNRLLSAAR
jgi:thiamine-phosphate pyrophosphorylase